MFVDCIFILTNVVSTFFQVSVEEQKKNLSSQTKQEAGQVQ